ncbi:MAG: 1-acyl-sn-glycerol-3-phosphate acyltransferase [Myxococcota bacterium]
MLDLAWPYALYAALGLLVVVVLVRAVRRHLDESEVRALERRFERTLARFKVEIDRFKLARKRAVRDLLNYDHAIWTQVEQLADSPRHAEKLRVDVHRYVHEIVPFFTPLSYYTVGQRLARWLLSALYRVDFRPEDVARIKQQTSSKPTSVVYVMNHRSNADYVIAAYVLADRIALSFAVGEWARVWPLEYVFKSFGSYFLRRGFRDPLYHTVLRRYVQLITKNAVTQALFPEGGLSRDGRFRAPKIGLLDNIIGSKADRTFERELMFVPVAINYDRVLEDRALTNELGNESGPAPKRRKRDMARQVIDIFFGNVAKLRRGQLRRHGIAAVRFGEPISFDAWHAGRGVDIFNLPKEARRGHIAELTETLMARIAALMPVTPLCLVAKALVDGPPMSRVALQDRVDALAVGLRERGVEIVDFERGTAWMVDGALERFRFRRLVAADNEGILAVVAGSEAILRYYANSFVHFEDGVLPHVEGPRT